MGRTAPLSTMSRDNAARSSANTSEAHGGSSGDETDVSSNEVSVHELGAGAATKQKKEEQKKGKKPITSPKYVMTNYIAENYDAAVFAVQFNYFVKPEDPLVFASAGVNQVSVYECIRGGGVRFMQSYIDPDPEEIFYTLVWTVAHETLEPLLAVAGQRGIIRIVGLRSMACIKHFAGHGGAVNDLKLHPKDSNLLLSASKDHSLRLWNIKTDVCVCILAGIDGHRDEVLNCDFNFNGTQVASCGIDHAIKLWRFDRREMLDAVAQSYAYNSQSSSRSFPTYCNNFADFSTRSVHSNYVDCVKWFGNFILSKSCENSIICWKPGSATGGNTAAEYNSGKVTKIHKFALKDSDIWFVRFSMDQAQKILVVGNQAGTIFLWNLDVEDMGLIRRTLLTHPKCTKSVRQTHVSPDGSIIIASCDGGTVWRWDLNKTLGAA